MIASISWPQSALNFFRNRILMSAFHYTFQNVLYAKFVYKLVQLMVFRVPTPCTVISLFRHFGGTCFHYFHNDSYGKDRGNIPSSFPYLWKTTILANFLFATHFLLTNISATTWTRCSEDTSSTFLRAFGTNFKSCTVSTMPAVKAWKLSWKFNLQKFSTQRLEKKTSYLNNKLVHFSVFPLSTSLTTFHISKVRSKTRYGSVPRASKQNEQKIVQMDETKILQKSPKVFLPWAFYRTCTSSNAKRSTRCIWIWTPLTVKGSKHFDVRKENNWSVPAPAFNPLTTEQ